MKFLGIDWWVWAVSLVAAVSVFLGGCMARFSSDLRDLEEAFYRGKVKRRRREHEKQTGDTLR
jgi:hypothetical protein